MDRKRVIKRLAALFGEMVKNRNSMGKVWKNIALGKEAFGLMAELPDVLPGEYETPAEKAALLGRMLEQMEETLSPRFCIGVREYMKGLDAGNEENERKMGQLRDFVNPDLPVEAYCQKYGRCLKFDPVERTQEWEDCIEDVERECARRLRFQRWRMGFCFVYWSVKREALEKRGIEWRSPQAMNPRVMFDWGKQ